MKWIFAMRNACRLLDKHGLILFVICTIQISMGLFSHFSTWSTIYKSLSKLNFLHSISLRLDPLWVIVKHKTLKNWVNIFGIERIQKKLWTKISRNSMSIGCSILDWNSHVMQNYLKGWNSFALEVANRDSQNSQL